MQTYLSKHWHRFPAEVWEKLFDFERCGTVTVGELPDDLYIELARPVYESWLNAERAEHEKKLAQIDDGIISKTVDVEWAAYDDLWAEYDEMELEDLKRLREKIQAEYDNLEDNDVLTNPDSAFQYLKSWHDQFTVDEKFAVELIVRWHETIKDLCGHHQEFVDNYVRLAREFLHSRNLRYMLLEYNETIRLVYNPAVIFMERILTLKHCCGQDAKLKVYYEDFENDVCNLIDDSSDSRKRSVLRVSSNLLEGSARHAINPSGTSLSDIIRNAPENIFPHPSVKDAILSVYKFYCDYIGGRHSGNTASRNLQNKDAILFGSVSALFADYLMNNN